MCGFSGQISFKTPINRSDIIKSIDSIEYRGPDAVGYWFGSNGKAGIAHRRLSIIDLSSSANQPMFDKLDSLIIAFNGEIYNFRKLRNQLIQLGYHFKTDSDTEVILKAYQEWGVDCLQKFEGMFSFLIMDLNASTAFMARDIAGEKPLYYHLNDTSFIFCSELKGVLAFRDVTRILDFYSFQYFLKNGYSPPNRSLVKDVFKLAPAHAAILKIDTGELRVWQYWDLPPLEKSNAITYPDLCDELFKLLNQSVSKQLISDVPLGVLLSGGLDSSIITALAAKNSQTLKTFTVTVPSHSNLNEADEARLIANHFGTEHTEIEADQITFEYVLSILKKLDEPIIDSSIIPTFLVSSLISKHCKVAVGGDGGDELFGGYSYYQDIVRAQRRSSIMPEFVLKGIGNLALILLPLGKPGRNYLEHLYPESWIGEHAVAKFYDEQSVIKLLHDFKYDYKHVNKHRLNTPEDKDLVNLIMRQDFYNYLSGDILPKIDRASMLNSLEMRAPFLDKAVIEFAFNKVQSDNKVTIKEKKILLKRAFKSILPKEFKYNRKQGFSVPLASWMKEPMWIKGMADVLLSGNQNCLNKIYMKELLNNQKMGYSNSERLFGLFLFEIWRTENKINYE